MIKAAFSILHFHLRYAALPAVSLAGAGYMGRMV